MVGGGDDRMARPPLDVIAVRALLVLRPLLHRAPVGAGMRRAGQTSTPSTTLNLTGFHAMSCGYGSCGYGPMPAQRGREDQWLSSGGSPFGANPRGAKRGGRGGHGRVMPARSRRTPRIRTGRVLTHEQRPGDTERLGELVEPYRTGLLPAMLRAREEAERHAGLRGKLLGRRPAATRTVAAGVAPRARPNPPPAPARGAPAPGAVSIAHVCYSVNPLRRYPAAAVHGMG
jgi:hypothetical protein